MLLGRNAKGACPHAQNAMGTVKHAAAKTAARGQPVPYRGQEEQFTKREQLARHQLYGENGHCLCSPEIIFILFSPASKVLQQ